MNVNRGDFSRKRDEKLDVAERLRQGEPASQAQLPSAEELSSSGVDEWHEGIPIKRHDITPEVMHRPDFYDNCSLSEYPWFQQEEQK
jgi:hypothetical protein